MALVYVNTDGVVEATTDDNPAFNDETVGAGKWTHIPDEEWKAVRDYVGNYVSFGMFITGTPPAEVQSAPDVSIAEVEQLLNDYPSMGWLIIEQLNL